MITPEKIVRSSLTRIDTIKVETAVNPLPWLFGLTLPVCGAVMFAIDDQAVRLGLLAIASLPVLATIVAYFLFLFRDPDRLQSEEYRLRQRALQILYRRGQSADIVDIANQRPRVETAKARRDEDKQG